MIILMCNKNDDPDNHYKYFIFNQIKNNIVNLKRDHKLKNNFGLVIKNAYPIIKYLISSFGRESIYELAKFVEDDVDYFFVGNIFDGKTLRKYNISKPIIVLYLIKPDLVPIAEKYDLEIVVSSRQWINQATPFIKQFIKVHLWYDSNLGKEGLNDPQLFIDLFKSINSPKIKLTGIGTKYNTSDKSFKLNKNKLKLVPDDVIKQHSNFQQLINSIDVSSYKLNIHVPCTFELDHQFTPSLKYVTRIGTLAYRNITLSEQVLEIKTLNSKDCVGYFCVNTPKTDNVRVALLKNNLILDNRNFMNVKIFTSSGKELQFLYYNYDPLAIIINNENIKVGDTLTIIYNDLFAYN